MKKVLVVLLLAAMLVSLCACVPKDTSDNKTPSETKGTTACEHQYTDTVTKKETCQEEGVLTHTCSKCKDTYTEVIEKQKHIYLDSDCTTAKTCVNCGTTQGRAKGHDYIQGVCTRCKEDQPGYKAFGTTTWQIMGVTFSEEELDVIQLQLSEEGAVFRADFWGLLTTLSPEKQEEYLKDPDSLIEYKRKQYYYKGFGESCPLTYEEEDNMVTIQVINGKNVGYLVLERKSVDKYTITEITGILFDDIITSCLIVGGTFEAVK